jgi:SET and MYND domain-containing protein
MLSLLSLNCHTITDDELIELGTGLYPLAALANHSCLPTAVQTFGPNAQLTLRALVPLAPGDEVTIAYVDLSLSRAERQAALRYAYLFECRCPACVPAPGVSAATDAARETERARMARALNQAGEMESRALDAEDWATALAQAEVGCQLAGALLSPTSPALGLHLLRAAKLHAHCGSLGTAAAFARRAAAILTVTHGEKADVVGQATEQLRGAQMELAFGPRGGHPRADGAMASGLRLSGEHPRQ